MPQGNRAATAPAASPTIRLTPFAVALIAADAVRERVFARRAFGFVVFGRVVRGVARRPVAVDRFFARLTVERFLAIRRLRATRSAKRLPSHGNGRILMFRNAIGNCWY